MNLNDYVLIDVSTGTMLCPQNCVLVPNDALTEAEWDALESSPDSEIIAIGRVRGIPLSRDVQALDAIAACLNGGDWSSDHLVAIADMIRSTGRTIEDI